MSDPSKAARNARIEAAHKGGASISALAVEFNLSQSRVRQVLINLEHARRTISRRLEAPLRRAK